jgi:hypothetical protein
LISAGRSQRVPMASIWHASPAECSEAHVSRLRHSDENACREHTAEMPEIARIWPLSDSPEIEDQ